MTVSYAENFLRLLLKWKASLWKAIWLDLLVYLVMYYAIMLIYRLLPAEPHQKTFDLLIESFETSTKYIPITFLLGFFVFEIVGRWWHQFNCISWPDKLMFFVAAYITGEELLAVRLTIARWLTLTSGLAWRRFSSRTLKRFPTVQHFVQAELMTPEELKVYENSRLNKDKWCLPILWANSLLYHCYLRKKIDSVSLGVLQRILESFKSGFDMLFIYDWITFPLVYTQVVVIATYGYFGICLIGRQVSARNPVPFPFFTLFEFLFYMGWLKVAQALSNPFGEDDDDFDMNYILDRNEYIGRFLANDACGQLPPMQQDIFWGKRRPSIPHTHVSSRVREKVPEGHLRKFTLSPKQMQVVDPEEPNENKGRKLTLIPFQRRQNYQTATHLLAAEAMQRNPNEK